MQERDLSTDVRRQCNSQGRVCALMVVHSRSNVAPLQNDELSSEFKSASE